MNVNQIKTATTQELVAEYNRLTGKSIKKFSSRAAGESQVERALRAAAPEKKTAQKPKREPRQPGAANRAAAVAATWTDPAVRTARSTHHAVRVVGKGVFPSTAKAFAALGLPKKLIISTRLKIVREGRARVNEYEFKQHDTNAD